MLAGIVGVSLLPNIPFVSRGVPWPTSLPGTINSFVPEGSVVLAVPFTNPSNSEAMAWQAVTGMHFRLIGGYANVVDPGKPYGQRQPPALQPTHVQELLGYPKLGYLLPWVSQQLAGAQLLTYLDRYSVDAVVFRSRGSITSPAYWYLTDTLGQPEVVQPGYAIWLPKGDAWKAPAPDPDYTTNTSVTPDQKREHVF